ncbi:unnamed protein product [Caenorhabditis brenneri]
MTEATSMFSVGETIVALDNGCPYEAKITKIKEHQGVLKYFVHFVGYKSRHDLKVVVGKERRKLFAGTVDDYVKENRSKISQAFLEKYETRATPRRETSVKKKKEESPGPSTSRLPRLDDRFSTQEWTLDIPKVLRKVVVDDYEFIGKGLLWSLPSKITIDTIIDDYERFLQPGPSDSHKMLAARGMVDYFNQVLKFKLLYPSEREQYNENSEDRPSSVYGLAHLLRFVFKAPEIIKFSKNEDRMLTKFVADMQQFVNFVARTYKDYYTGEEDYSSAD